MKKNMRVLFLASFFSSMIYSSQVPEVFAQYEIALGDLIKAHQQTTPKKAILLTPGSLILATYQKIINWDIAYISGYARIVSSEVVRKFPYYQDLTELTKQYAVFTKHVKGVVSLFPKELQSQAFDMFKNALTDSVVQTCYNIVQQVAYNNELSDEQLTAAYQAYQLAWDCQTKNMKIMGVGSVAEFDNSLTQNMQILFTQAIAKVQASLSLGMSSGSDLADLYTKLEQYYLVLYQVYTNSGDSANAQGQQKLLAAVQQQQKQYELATSQLSAANTSVQAARIAITLDVNSAATVSVNLNSNILDLANAAKSYQTAAGNFAAAQDLFGENICNYQVNMIGNFDLQLRNIQTLWALFLNDQSNNQNTPCQSYPSLQSFVTGQSSGDISDAVSSLQSLIGFCSLQSSYSNSIGSIQSALQNSSQTFLVPTMLSAAIAFAQNALLNQNQFKQNPNVLLNLKLLQDAQDGTEILVNWANAALSAVSAYQAGTSVTTFLAQAMTYAQLLDTTFIAQKDLSQYVPHLPDGLTSGEKTWVNFTAQFFVQANIVTTADAAIAQIGQATIIKPVHVSVKDIAKIKNQAAQAWSQAQQSATALNFASASTQYENAMKLYQKLYGLNLTLKQQAEMLSNANYAKTRLVACSLASVPQSSGSVTFGQLKNIPQKYRANEYQLSIDAAAFGSTLPDFLSSATIGTALTTFSSSQKLEIFAVVKAYMVAQALADQGYNFTDYYNDYHMSTLLQPSNTVTKTVEKISNYLGTFDNISIASLTMQSVTAAQIELINLPLTPVTSVCSTVQTAGTYYSSAALLFSQGTSTITFGGQPYYPGDDAASAQVMYKNLAYAFACAAKEEMKKVNSLMQQVNKQLGVGPKGVTAKALPKGFFNSLQAIENGFATVQALLNAPQSSAYVYFVQAGETELAQAVLQEYLGLYQVQIQFMQPLLISDPASNDYQTLVTDINKAYVKWASELNSDTDSALIRKINQKVADLYVAAGDKAKNTSYYNSYFPKISQFHYMVAAQYYRSAQMQYKQLQDTDKVAALDTKISKLYYLACQQNLKLYLHAKKHDISYTSVTTGSITKVSFAQLVQDFDNMASLGDMDSGEQDTYSMMQNLLLDAAMVYENLSASAKKQSEGGASSQTNSNDQIKPAVLQFLQQNSIVSGQQVEYSQVPYAQTGIKEQLVGLAAIAYTQFGQDPENFGSWNRILFMVVENFYIQDFLGATASMSVTEKSSDVQQFLNAIQKEAQGLQNPSAGYVQ